MRPLFDHIGRECDLPPLPAVAMRAMTMVRDPDAKSADLTRLVATDAAIAARVLRISRSALYVCHKAPSTLGEAIATVGFEALRKILVAASARSAYKANDDSADSGVANVSITVASVNDAPVAINDSYPATEDTPLSIAVPGVLGNDTDADGSL